MPGSELESTAPDWFLVIGDLRLGALWLTDVDQPWYHCVFEPTLAFEAVRPLFDAANQALRAREFDTADELIEEIAAKGVCLVWGNGEAQPRPDVAGSLQLIGGRMIFRPDNVQLQHGKPIPQYD